MIYRVRSLLPNHRAFMLYYEIACGDTFQASCSACIEA